MARSKDKEKIDVLAKSYLEHKRIVKEAEEEIVCRNYERVNTSRNIIKHIEYVIETLDEPGRFIVRCEVIEGKKGKWYLGYFSAPSYYRIRKKAYEEFFRCLDR